MMLMAQSATPRLAALGGGGVGDGVADGHDAPAGLVLAASRHRQAGRFGAADGGRSLPALRAGRRALERGTGCDRTDRRFAFGEGHVVGGGSGGGGPVLP